MLGIVIQARLGATRLPNKMLLPFYHEKGVLELLIGKLQKQFTDIPLVVATTNSSNDDKIIDLCEKLNIHYYRGSEDNVLQRFIDAGEQFKLTKIIRVCADNPFLSMEFLKTLKDRFSQSNSDYLSFKTSVGLPVIKTHFGFWAEGVTLNALKQVSKATNNKIYLEHVTNYIYENSHSFQIEFLEVEDYIERAQDIRLTMDTEEDYQLLKEIYKKYILLENQTVQSLLELVQNEEHWLLKMNSQIKNNGK